MGIADHLNPLAEDEVRTQLSRCCGARAWVDGMLARRPWKDDDALFADADELWSNADRETILEAFDHHPRIGADLGALRAKYAPTKAWSAGEQRQVQEASEEVLEALRDGNLRYEAAFGHIFIVCASGKRADEMLALLQERLPNDPATELQIAAAEHAKITRLRLEKLTC
jgi:2-oxo-4-hydroxy-4-carboxy-5-ureidoimidazoline decarboxylase